MLDSRSQRRVGRDNMMALSYDPRVVIRRLLTWVLSYLETPEMIAYELARRTPRIVSLCLVFLLAGVIASRLDLSVEGFLWGIPSLGPASFALGMLLWSLMLMLRPDMPAPARAALRRAMVIQLPGALVCLIGLAYFAGMALRLW